MNKMTRLFTLLLALVLLLAACDSTNNQDADIDTDTGLPAADTLDETTAEEADVASDESVADTGDEDLDAWLQRLNSDEIETVNMDSDLQWARGYFLYYGELENLGVDNLIYNALEARRRLDTGEFSEGNMPQNAENLLTIAEELQYDSEAPLTDQVGQTPEVRDAILEHVVESQADLSPEEALASNNIVGVFGPPAPEAIGGKYLVYTQESPDAEFQFQGVILAVDAAGQDTREPYSVDEWQDLAWLGDASGPFWDDLPAGASGDPDSTSGGRPGVLLISESTYNDITSS